MLADINELKKMLWLDERTRAMFVHFSVYNANFNLYAACNLTSTSMQVLTTAPCPLPHRYAACNLIFRFSPGGVITPIPKFKVRKDNRRCL